MMRLCMPNWLIASVVKVTHEDRGVTRMINCLSTAIYNAEKGNLSFSLAFKMIRATRCVEESTRMSDASLPLIDC